MWLRHRAECLSESSWPFHGEAAWYLLHVRITQDDITADTLLKPKAASVVSRPSPIRSTGHFIWPLRHTLTHPVSSPYVLFLHPAASSGACHEMNPLKSAVCLIDSRPAAPDRSSQARALLHTSGACSNVRDTGGAVWWLGGDVCHSNCYLYIIYITYMNKIKRNVAFFYYYNEQHVKRHIFNRDPLILSIFAGSALKHQSFLGF